MKTTSLVLLLSLLCGCANSQEIPATEIDPGIPADFNDYLRKVYPGMDPGGKHDLFALSDPKDKKERHEYTTFMIQMILEYMGNLDMGSTISKVFDQYSRGKEANQATFKVLHALVLMNYPLGSPNTTDAQRLLLEASESAKDFAFPPFLLAQYFEYPRLRQIENTSPRETLALLDKALEIKPDFLRAVLLKSQIYLMANPPRVLEVKEMLEPFMAAFPGILDDFEDLLMLYAATHSEVETTAKFDELHQNASLSDAQKVRVLRVKAHGELGLNRFDAAIGTLEALLKLLDPAKSPTEAIWAHQRLGAAWGSKAGRLKQQDPELAGPDARANFDKWIENAANTHLQAAEVERKHMPLTLRGSQARMYAEFLVQLRKLEKARDWLVAYLKDTDLPSAQRNALDNLRIVIDAELDPTEEGFLRMYQEFIAGDKMERLAESLELAVQRLKVEGLHFKTEAALVLFLSLLENRVRKSVGFAAILAADTAMQLGGDAPTRAAEAIIVRLEKETELNSDEQATLQADLCDAMKVLGHRPSQERAVRHMAGLIQASKADTINTMMRDIVNVWMEDEAWLKALKAPPAQPSAMDKFKQARAAAWLIKLADALKQE